MTTVKNPLNAAANAVFSLISALVKVTEAIFAGTNGVFGWAKTILGGEKKRSRVPNGPVGGLNGLFRRPEIALAGLRAVAAAAALSRFRHLAYAGGALLLVTPSLSAIPQRKGTDCVELARALQSKTLVTTVAKSHAVLSEASSLKWQRLETYEQNYREANSSDAMGSIASAFFSWNSKQDKSVQVSEEDWNSWDEAKRRDILLDSLEVTLHGIVYHSAEALRVIRECLVSTAQNGLHVEFVDNIDTHEGTLVVGYYPQADQVHQVTVTDIKWIGHVSEETQTLEDRTQRGVTPPLPNAAPVQERVLKAGESFLLKYVRRVEKGRAVPLMVTVSAAPAKVVTRDLPAEPDPCEPFVQECQQYCRDLAAWKQRKTAADKAISDWSKAAVGDLYGRKRSEYAKDSRKGRDDWEVRNMEAPDRTWVVTGAGGSVSDGGNFHYFRLRYTRMKANSRLEHKEVTTKGKNNHDGNMPDPNTFVELPDGYAAVGIGLKVDGGDLVATVLTARKYDFATRNFTDESADARAFDSFIRGAGSVELEVKGGDNELLVGIEQVGAERNAIHTLSAYFAPVVAREPRPAPFTEPEPVAPIPPPGCTPCDCR